MKHTEQKKKQKQSNNEPMAGTPSPAYNMYPLGPGWSVLSYVTSHLLVRSHETSIRWIDHAASLGYLATAGSWLRKWIVRPLIIGFYVAAGLQYLPHILLTLLFLVFYLSFLLAWLFLAFIAIGVLRFSSRIYKMIGNIGYRCPSCYKSFFAPVYLCPTCKAEHNRLQPGISGVFVHCCRKCATRLPTLDPFGRRRLTRLCPSCHCTLSSDLGTGPAIHIALVGGSATRKTSYLIAAFKTLKHKRSYRFKMIFVDPVQEQTFEQDLHLIQKQQPPASASSIKPRAWVLKMCLPRKPLPRLLYLYDPAGEAFRASLYTALQEYYSFLNGILFIIDPLTLPASQEMQEESSVDANILSHSVGMEVIQVYERMMQMFEISAGFSAKKRYPQPVAVVLTGTHTHQCNYQHRAAEHRLIKDNLSDAARNHFIRERLRTSGLDNFLRDIEAHFAHVQYFSCPALEDLNSLQDTNSSEQLLQPLLWLLS